MKKIGLALVLLAGLFSCERNDLYQEPVLPDVEDLLPMESMHIVVPEGKAALVRFYSDTLAVVTETADIMVPKSGVRTRAFDEAVTIEYLDDNNNLGSRYQTFQVIAFEDSERGDYDYNDLIVHVRILQREYLTRFDIQPVALGSIKPIKFGVRIGDEDFLIADNCREELFAGKTGYINTTMDGTGTTYKFEGNEVKTLKENVPCTFGKDINWFIEVDGGQRLYAVSENYPSLNGDNMAYGLIFTNITSGYRYKGADCGFDWFNYPLEKVHIKKTYPGFDRYFKGISSFKDVFHPGKAVEGKYYKAIVADGKEATKECIYAITYPD